MKIKTFFKATLANQPVIQSIFRFFFRLLKLLSLLVTIPVLAILHLLDYIIPKSSNFWIFPVHFKLHTFTDNNRALFESIKGDNNIKKIILTRSKKIRVQDALNTEIVAMRSWKGVWYLWRSGVLFIQHSLYLDLRAINPFSKNLILPYRRLVVNTWHGIPIKSISSTNSGLYHPVIRHELKHYLLTCSAASDKAIMQAAFGSIPDDRIIITGMPRNDFLLVDEKKLPPEYQQQLEQVLKIKTAKKLVVYAPTFRETDSGGKYYNFTKEEIEAIRNILEKHNAIMAFRLHYHSKDSNYEQWFDNQYMFDFGSHLFPDMSMLIRSADVIISDYSGLFVDSLYITKRVINFAYDLEHYIHEQRGLAHPLHIISPVQICTTFQEFENSLANSFNKFTEDETVKYAASQNFFFTYIDNNNSFRIVSNVKKLLHLH
jgi:CDP-glycerol glycerophosphotransferase